jgi:hypothetical protein
MDAIEQVGKEVRQVIWNTIPGDVRGMNQTLLETSETRRT